jgi:PBP1b-binding outer membrane lipoprotein LpoB
MRPYFSALIFIIFLSACAQYPSSVDTHFGAATRMAVEKQSVHHENFDEREQASSDAQSAKSAIDRYQKSFDQMPPSTNVFNIGVGSTTSTTPQ